MDTATHEIGEIFNIVSTGGKGSAATLKVVEIDDQDRATEFEIISNDLPISGEHGLSMHVLRITGAKSTDTNAAYSDVIRADYGHHPCSQRYYGISKKIPVKSM